MICEICFSVRWSSFFLTSFIRGGGGVGRSPSSGSNFPCSFFTIYNFIGGSTSKIFRRTPSPYGTQFFRFHQKAPLVKSARVEGPRPPPPQKPGTRLLREILDLPLNFKGIDFILLQNEIHPCWPYFCTVNHIYMQKYDHNFNPTEPGIDLFLLFTILLVD